MLLVIDVGNTHVLCGLYRGKRLGRTWRIPTVKPVNKLALDILRGVSKGKISGVCISSVVPWVDSVLEKAIAKKLGCPVIFATYKNIGLPIRRYPKEEVGADRLVNALAAYERYKGPLIIVDFGTATTFDVVTAKGEYSGGAIAPGIGLANRSLSDYTAKLPRVKIKKTNKVIRYDTVSSMQSGVFHGYVGLVKHLVGRIAVEMGEKPKVIATGGLAPLLFRSSKVIEAVHPDLTLEGLRLIWQRNLFQTGK